MVCLCTQCMTIRHQRIPEKSCLECESKYSLVGIEVFPVGRIGTATTLGDRHVALYDLILEGHQHSSPTYQIKSGKEEMDPKCAYSFSPRPWLTDHSRQHLRKTKIEILELEVVPFI